MCKKKTLRNQKRANILSWHCICGARYSWRFVRFFSQWAWISQLLIMSSSSFMRLKLNVFLCDVDWFLSWEIVVVCSMVHYPLGISFVWHLCLFNALLVLFSLSSELWVGLPSFPWEYTLYGSFGEQRAISWCRWRLTGGNCLLQGYTSFLWIFSFISTRCKIRRSKHELACALFESNREQVRADASVERKRGM